MLVICQQPTGLATWRVALWVPLTPGRYGNRARQTLAFGFYAATAAVGSSSRNAAEEDECVRWIHSPVVTGRTVMKGKHLREARTARASVTYASLVIYLHIKSKSIGPKLSENTHSQTPTVFVMLITIQYTYINKTMKGCGTVTELICTVPLLWQKLNTVNAESEDLVYVSVEVLLAPSCILTN